MIIDIYVKLCVQILLQKFPKSLLFFFLKSEKLSFMENIGHLCFLEVGTRIC